MIQEYQEQERRKTLEPSLSVGCFVHYVWSCEKSRVKICKCSPVMHTWEVVH